MGVRSFLLVVIFACAAAAQAPRGGSMEAALLDLENRWVAALSKGDLATLDAIYADTYVDTDEEGHRSDKRGVMDVLKSGDLKMNQVSVSDMHVYLYGTFAVVTGASQQIGTFKGKPVKPKITFTDSFILQNGKWRAVASQRTALP